MENEAEVSVLLVGPVSARVSSADCPAAALHVAALKKVVEEVTSNCSSQAAVAPMGDPSVKGEASLVAAVSSSNWLAPGSLPDELDEPLHGDGVSDPGWQSAQAVPPSEGMALAACMSMWPATGPLVMVTAPDALWHVPLGNPRELAVDEPPEQVPSATLAGVTVMERTTTAKVAVVLPEEEAADAGCAHGPPLSAATVARAATLPGQSRPRRRRLTR